MAAKKAQKKAATKKSGKKGAPKPEAAQAPQVAEIPKVINLGMERVDPRSLVKALRNPRRGDIEAIKKSLKANGWYGTAVVRKKDRMILVGNHRTEAATQVGIPGIDVVWVDVDDAHAERMIMVDNRTNDLAGYDQLILNSMLADMRARENLIGTGFTEDQIDKMLAPPTPPSEFVQFGANIKTDHRCPKCGYEWSGKKG